MTDKAALRELFESEFRRRCRAAEEGCHLPSYLELLTGMSFFRDDMQDDADEFVRRTLPRLGDDASASALREALASLTDHPTIDAFRTAADACRSESGVRDRTYDEWAARFDLYAAALGCGECAVQTALEAISRSNGEVHRDRGYSSKLVAQALGWLETIDDHFDTPEERAAAVRTTGEALVSRIVDERISAKKAQPASDDRTEDVPWWTTLSSSRRPPPKTNEPGDGRGERGPTAVVFTGVGNQNTEEGKRVSAAWRSLIDRPLRLIPVPDLGVVRKALLAEFPFAAETVDKLLTELAGRAHVALRPTVFVGEPGVGKTRFTQAFLRELGVPSSTYPCGGVSDASMAGTSRRWASGEPALVTSLIRQHSCASPGIVLDEIEKVGSSRNGGNLLDALLAFLEPQTAAKWMDPYLQAPVDLSHVIWLATANDVSGLPAPLKDRCRILRFPRPGPEHLPALATHLLVQALRDRDRDPRWAMPLTGEELGYLGQAWSGGSLRRLQRLVEGVLAVRERECTLH